MIRGSVLFLFACASVAACASIPFKHRFAPQDGLIAPVERPCREEICLNGTWQFQPVAAHRGSEELAQPTGNGWEKTPIRIPSPWNVNAFPVESRQGGDFRCFPSYPEAWEKVEAGWLRRSFIIPKGWKGRRFILRFQAVAGDAEVFVNGKSVARHFDIFLPFEADVTDAVRIGEKNELRVGIRKASLSDVPGKYGRRTYQGGSMWGQAIAGIWQDVFLTAVPAVRIQDAFVKPDVARDILSADVTLRNDGDQPARVQLAGLARAWVNQAGKDVLSAPEPKWRLGDKALDFAAQTVTVPAHGETTATMATAVNGRLKTWSPASPNLYGLVCTLNGETRDTKYTRFGWRQITFSGTKVLLNGQPLTMKGDSWHFMGIPQMTRRYAWAWFRALRNANLNAVRLHAQPYPSFYLDMADEQGILVLDETAVWASDGGPKLDTPSYWDDTQRHLRDLIHRDRNHPSVFGWSVSNEVMAVVRNVFHAPKEIEDQADRMNGIWAGICCEEDPTRIWISADGEEDGRGALPVSVIHYGDRGTMQRANRSGKPWGVGEAGPAYYGSPKQIAEMSGNPRSYLSFEDRMEGVALASYRSLADQREEGGAYRSVFNLVWYGLKPLELGLIDTTRAPLPTDGITFPPYKDGEPGVQPERLGPYCSTLNPGYDPRLPLYSPWPLFEAIKNAQAEPPIEYRPTHSFANPWEAARPAATIQRVQVVGGAQSHLADALRAIGAMVADDSEILFVDGIDAPSPAGWTEIGKAQKEGKTIFFWGVGPSTVAALNAVLPKPLALTTRTASSLVATLDPVTAGLSPASLYFSELSPSTILTAGLGGPFVEEGKVLLAACDTDWKRWNNQGETVKTAMVLRSEREAKPSGAALVRYGTNVYVCNLPMVAETSQAASLNRTLLQNLGIALGDSLADRNLIGPDGTLTSALYLGPFDLSRGENHVSPNSGGQIVAGATAEGRAWKAVSDAGDVGSGYLSVWVYSPKTLDNLLLDPHLPNVSLELTGADSSQRWLNGNPLSNGSLMLREGWNHLLLRVVRGSQKDRVRIRLVSNQPDFLGQMRAALESGKEHRP